jgi:DNA-binding transcriptional LysR family regulator
MRRIALSAITLFMNVNDGLPLPDLGVFVAVAEARGFSAAARRLSVSKAMVSTSVRRLEKRLGVQLLQRTTRTLSLTEDGAAVLPHAQRALLAAREAEDAARHARLTPRGTLKLNAPMSFGLLHVVPALGAFARAYPDVQVDLVLDDRYVDLVAGGFDLALRIGALPDSGLVVQRLGVNRMALVAHHRYLARRGRLSRPAELADHAALQYAHTSTDWVLQRGRRSVSVRVRPTLRVNSSLALHQAALQGLGIARLPRFVLGGDLRRKRLVQVLPEWSLPETPIQLVTTSRELPRKTRAFIEFFRAHLGATWPWDQPD